MKITDEGMQRILNRYIQQQSEAARLRDARRDMGRTKDVEEDIPSDRVTLSEQALKLQHAFKELEKLADARQEKVESIRRDLELGRYEVTGAMVAKKLLEP